jgi:hypothetical protein
MNQVRYLVLGPCGAAVATLLLVAPGHLHGQDSLIALRGQRVRVTARPIGTERLVGTLTAIDTNGRTLEIQGRDTLWRLPFASVAALAVSRPNNSARVAGALLGASLGAFVGAGLGAAAGEDCAPQGLTPCYDKGSLAMTGAVFLGLIGAALGYHLAKEDSWEAVPLADLGLSVSRRSQDGVLISVVRHF